MKKLTMIVMVALLVLPISIRAQNLVKEYHDSAPNDSPDLFVEVWVDNEDGIYYQGEEVQVSFQANRDCFVAVYSLDTQGGVTLLFPEGRWDDGFIRGGEVYSIPGSDADYDLLVSGPEGIEHIQAVASTERMDIPDWYAGADFAMNDREDPEDFIDELNYRYFECRWGDCFKAYDHTSIYVKSPHYYYRPVYVPQYWYTAPRYSMIYIDYPYGGEVYIDGVYFGIAPLWIPRVVIGWHWFTIYDRYGYCWEHHMNVYHDRTVHIDHTIVNTSRSKVSQYGDLRSQAKKYRKSDYVLSEERVKSSRTTTEVQNKADRFSRPGTEKYSKDRTTKATTNDRTRTVTKSRDGAATKSTNKWDNWSSRKSGSDSRSSTKSTATKRSSGTKSTKENTSVDRPRSTGSKQEGTVKKSGNTTKSGGSKSSSSMSRSSSNSGSSSKSSGSVKPSGGSSTPKSSGSSTPKSSGGGSSKSSGGSKSKSGGR